MRSFSFKLGILLLAAGVLGLLLGVVSPDVSAHFNFFLVLTGAGAMVTFLGLGH